MDKVRSFMQKMVTPINNSFSENFKRSKFIPFFVIALLVIGVVFTLQQVKQQQTTRSLAATTPPVSVTIDAAADAHPISPYIYGTAANSDAYQKTMGATVSRWGGNQVTRHNWEVNDANAGSDWGLCFQSYLGRAAFSNVWYKAAGSPAGLAIHDAVAANKANRAETLYTVPMIGWVAKDGDNNNCSSGVPSDDGPPINSSGAIAGYDPTANRNATSVRSQVRKGSAFTTAPSTTDGVVYQDESLNYITQTFGKANVGGVKFYAFDNEYDLWSDTHRDVHPARVGYGELLSLYTQFGDMVKDIDPSALTTGPVSWGWTNYWFSPLDRGDGSYSNPADRQAHGNVPLLQWFLRQMKAHDAQVGRRTLDILDVHYYPQAGQYPDGTDAALRLRSTRELWDPTYNTESWMAGTEGGPNIQVIRRLKGWINQEYPGTKLGITEWNWGGDSRIDGGLAIADVLGIFGREDVYLANYWTTPADNSPGYFAWRMYRNYDGAFSKFGDRSVQATLGTSTDVNSISAYASKDSATGQLKVMLINKLPTSAVPVNFTLANFTPSSSAQVYEYSQADTSQIKKLADLTGVSGTVSYTVNPYSITLLVFNPSSGTPSQTPIPTTVPTVIPTSVPTATPTPTRAPTPSPIPTALPTALPTPVRKIGDFNGDNKVDIVDLSMFLSHWNTTDPLYDLNHDTKVDIVDLSIFLSHWGT